jgi:hypothetical protein
METEPREEVDEECMVAAGAVAGYAVMSCRTECRYR